MPFGCVCVSNLLLGTGSLRGHCCQRTQSMYVCTYVRTYVCMYVSMYEDHRSYSGRGKEDLEKISLARRSNKTHAERLPLIVLIV